MRYRVDIDGCTVFFDTLDKADHYARLNAGTVEDMETGETISIYVESED